MQETDETVEPGPQIQTQTVCGYTERWQSTIWYSSHGFRTTLPAYEHISKHFVISLLFEASCRTEGIHLWSMSQRLYKATCFKSEDARRAAALGAKYYRTSSRRLHQYGRPAVQSGQVRSEHWRTSLNGGNAASNANSDCVRLKWTSSYDEVRYTYVKYVQA